MPAPSSQYVDLMHPEFYKIFDDTLKAGEPYYPNIIRVLDSVNQFEKMSALAGIGHLAQIDEGAEPAESNPKQKYDKTFTHLTYSIISRLCKNAMDDDRSGLLKQVPRMQAEAGIKTLETIPAAMFDRSQNASYTSGDGKVLCATDHPRADGGTFSNRPTANADLGYAVLEAAITDYEGIVDDNGDPAMLVPKMLLINQSNRFMAAQLLENMDKVGTANRDLNAVKNQFPGLKAYIYPYLTDTDSWYLIGDRTEKQIFMFLREKLNKRMYVAPDNTLDAIFLSRFRAIAGWLDPKDVYGSIGG